MTNEEIVKYIYRERKNNKEKLDNSRMKSFLTEIGNPEKDLRFIHVTGTNGKGSTTTMIANILKQSGYKVGKFVSPYIISFNERIQINNEFISDKDLEKYIKKLEPIIDKMESQGDAPIGFEIITAIAFMYYKDNKCDIVCLELGLGGRLDPTNVIENNRDIKKEMRKEEDAPRGFEKRTAIAFMYFKDNNCDIVCLEVGLGGRLDPTNVIKTTEISIITVIDYDHTHILGDTLEQIATEKCGIIKPDKITVTYPQQQP